MKTKLSKKKQTGCTKLHTKYNITFDNYSVVSVVRKVHLHFNHHTTRHTSKLYTERCMRQEWVWCLKRAMSDLPPSHRQHKQPPCLHCCRPHDLPGVNPADEYSHSRKRCADFDWRCSASKWRFPLNFGSPLFGRHSPCPCVDIFLLLWNERG